MWRAAAEGRCVVSEGLGHSGNRTRHRLAVGTGDSSVDIYHTVPCVHDVLRGNRHQSRRHLAPLHHDRLAGDGHLHRSHHRTAVDTDDENGKCRARNTEHREVDDHPTPADIYKGEGVVGGNLAGSDVTEERAQHPAVHLLHPRHLGQLLPALLPDILLL